MGVNLRKLVAQTFMGVSLGKLVEQTFIGVISLEVCLLLISVFVFQAAIEFCMNFNTKVNRKKLVRGLFTVHRTRCVFGVCVCLSV